ncbi:hypothetical protein [Corynebacterium tapiri]|uniref:Uncharacterized protein n=1 Tax=Corynebacterium tapiri TaxID=1448266 RepID=A0A5C4U6M4_9CORY|nr:hypothetical protein [Corynebacterium tapiri]TNM00536.1 hypothetical protein FHE74_00905 [Corynebacterium tapiri]
MTAVTTITTIVSIISAIIGGLTAIDKGSSLIGNEDGIKGTIYDLSSALEDSQGSSSEDGEKAQGSSSKSTEKTETAAPEAATK